MNAMEQTALAGVIADAAVALTGRRDDFDGIVNVVGNAQFVLIGEASHGTHEFYDARARITQKLIEERGFTAVAIEADFPHAYQVNRYVKGHSSEPDANAALREFKRFPTWMWRNTDVLDFVDWLRDYNDNRRDDAAKVGFYGLDLYSLHSSMQAVVDYLDKVDAEAAKRARYRYSCFDHYGEDPQTYGYAMAFDVDESCENAVVDELIELQRQAADYMRQDGIAASDAFFYAEQNARLAKNAEAYYRAMFKGRVSTWNLRDQHMAETLDALTTHLGQHQQQAKVVVWAHNSHLGDARATEMGRLGELNLGQLARERYGQKVCNIGFSTYTGTVTAASDWGGAAERKRVRPALAESYEALFYEADFPNFYLDLRHDRPVGEGLREPRLQRAIGVIYRPETERLSHYFQARLADQFDVVIHFDESHAVEPLERNSDWERGELPETYPTGI